MEALRRRALVAALVALVGMLAIGRVCHWLGLRHSLAHALAEFAALFVVGLLALAILERRR